MLAELKRESNEAENVAGNERKDRVCRKSGVVNTEPFANDNLAPLGVSTCLLHVKTHTFVGLPTKRTMLAVLAAANSAMIHAIGSSFATFV